MQCCLQPIEAPASDLADPSSKTRQPIFLFLAGIQWYENNILTAFFLPIPAPSHDQSFGTHSISFWLSLGLTTGLEMGVLGPCPVF